MQPPEDNWDWVAGKITHIDMAKKLQTDLPYLIDAYNNDGPFTAEYFHENVGEEVTNWEDYAFRWLTMEEYKVFHLPGPNMAKRSEFHRFSCIFLSIIWNIFTVPAGTDEYEAYMDDMQSIGK